MPFALIIVGLLMIVVGARNTYAAFGQQVKNDFISEPDRPSFLYWLVAIGVVGSIGYIEKFRPFSYAFMSLIIISMILKNGGFFAQISDALKNGPIEAKAPEKTADVKTAAKSSTAWFDAGPLGTIDPKIAPGSPLDKAIKGFQFIAPFL